LARWRKVKQGKIEEKKQKESVKVEQTLVSANFGLRVKAFITDMFMIMMPIMYIMTYIVLDGKDEFQSNEIARWLGMFLYGAISIIFWIKAGQTPGKKAYDIIIIDSNTKQKPKFFRAILRYFAFLFSAVSMIGLLVPLFRKDKKSLHDLISSTSVINIKDYKKLNS
jgi:uncharacterized RDD family membrane protein YckC